MVEKRCIFHIPNYLPKSGTSGSGIRPRKMLNAFEELGYHVDYVMGYGKQRKQQIKKIENNIKSGIKYEFLYSESSTMPTLLTEKNHLPKYPTLDFGFFKFCKKQGIKIGLFYRDIYWKFDIYKSSVSFFKRSISIPCYYNDLKMYDKLVDILYLPSKKMRDFVKVVDTFYPLPPGCDSRIEVKDEDCKNNSSQYLQLFYVGGVGDIYNLTKLLTVVKKLSFVRLTVCCKEKEWEEEKKRYSNLLGENIQIVHKSGEELEEYYSKADICMLFFESKGYRSFCMPVKLFEYLGHIKPIIAVEDSSAGEFVEENDIGWTIPFEGNCLEKILMDVYHDKTQLDDKLYHLKKTLGKNTWKARAEQVIHDLT